MKCTVMEGESLDQTTRAFIAERLCRDGSVFRTRLISGDAIDGHVAIVEDFGEVIGWARTEPWAEDGVEVVAGGVYSAMTHWQTLEAFVAKDYRWRGVATFAAAGLVAVAFQDDLDAAVFHPHMMMLARKVGLRPVLFREQGDGWVRA